MRLKGRRILIAGGSQGIGLGITRRFVNEGARVVVGSNELGDQPPLLPEGVHWIRAELSTVSGPKQLVEQARQHFGVCIESLLYVAGIYRPDYLGMQSPESVWDLTYQIKVRGSFLAALQFVAQLDDAAVDPNCTFVSSVNAQRSEPQHLAYDGACAAVEGQTRAFAVEFPRVRFNCIAPGLVETRLTQAALSDPLARQHALRCIPQGRIGSPEDYGGPAVFLCSQDSAYMTGAVLAVDGGIAALQAPQAP